jgi:DNA replication protein DnaC
MNPATTDQVENLTLLFKDHSDDFLQHLRSWKAIAPGQGLESLSEDHAGRILANPKPHHRAITEIRWKREEQALASERFHKEQDARCESKRRKILDSIPPQFRSLTAEHSPRPAQFKFVESFWDSEAEDLRDVSGEPKRFGLFLSGKSGSGKTAAATALYLRTALEDWSDDYAFRRSVEFVRMVKSKHLSGEARATFEREFELLRDTDGIIFLDDLGTEKFVDTSAEDVLFDLFDSRANWNRRTVVTCNYSPKELAAMFSPKNAEKMLRRFNQFFLRIDFDRK